ncbi:MAG TPA: hypothetical protein VF865_04780 [Acidobacteriaceae bacterium]
MEIVTVDLLDKAQIVVSYSDGMTAVYNAAQLKTLEPIQIKRDKPGISGKIVG